MEGIDSKSFGEISAMEVTSAMEVSCLTKLPYLMLYNFQVQYLSFSYFLACDLEERDPRHHAVHVQDLKDTTDIIHKGFGRDHSNHTCFEFEREHRYHTNKEYGRDNKSYVVDLEETTYIFNKC